MAIYLLFTSKVTGYYLTSVSMVTGPEDWFQYYCSTKQKSATSDSPVSIAFEGTYMFKIVKCSFQTGVYLD